MALRDRASNTYYEIFRVSSWAFAAYIIILISAKAEMVCAAEIQHTIYEVLQVRVNSLTNSVVLYINCNAFHTHTGRDKA